MNIPSFSFLSQLSEEKGDKPDERGRNPPLDFSFLTQQQQAAQPSNPQSQPSDSEPAVVPSQRKKLSLTRSLNTTCPSSLSSQAVEKNEPAVKSSVSTGGSSFENAFSSIKQTKFYEPPPDPPPNVQVPIQPPLKSKPRNPRAVLVRLYQPARIPIVGNDRIFKFHSSTSTAADSVEIQC
jgi:hypothetical protein